ncbi:hypothetical protein LDENG_00232230, partial [Lucifuga dentata]
LSPQALLRLLWSSRGSWGLYLQVQTQQLLEVSLSLLNSSYTSDHLYRPVWISTSTQPPQDFVSTVEHLFPHVTLVLQSQSALIQSAAGLSQRVALHLNASSLRGEELNTLMQAMDRYDLILEEEGLKSSAEALAMFKTLMTQHKSTTNTHMYVISDTL